MVTAIKKYSLLGLSIIMLMLSHVIMADEAEEGALLDVEQSSTYIPVDALRQFAEVLSQIKENYVEEISDEELIDFAIRGMVSSLDPYSTYLTERQFSSFQSDTKGEFGGLGLELVEDLGLLRVIAPIEGTPASRAGIKAGDLITHVDSNAVKIIGTAQALERLRGKPGTKIQLIVLRENQKETLSFSLTRAVVRISSVRYETLEPGFGYIRINQFQNDTPAAVKSAITEIKRQNHQGLEGLILDLRDDPGGLLNAALEVSDLFLDRGIIVSTKDRYQNIGSEFRASAPDLLLNVPIIVLINRGSASASEIVAGALQANKRAILMGETSYGKGSVQTIYPLNKGAALKLTTAKYYIADGRSIHDVGIVPDIEVVAPITDDEDNDSVLNKALEQLK